MTVRDATLRESPVKHVLYIEELRKHLGVRTAASEGSSSMNATQTQPEVLLIGHDMHDDFKIMKTDGIDIQKYFHYSGCVDTHAIIDDTGAEMGKSLSSLVSHYGIAELELKKPGSPGKPAKLSFVGAHCAGNDAIATLGSVVAQALDLNLTSNHERPVSMEDWPEDWFNKPLQKMNMNMILLAYDTETVENHRYKPNVTNRTSEHGFAWMRIADVAHVPPGEYGKNWRPFFHARHWINREFRTFKNRYFCVGNPNGFWPQYGTSQYYNESECPAPFHKLFEELASVPVSDIEEHDSVGEVTAMLEQATIGDIPSVVEGTWGNLLNPGGNAASGGKDLSNGKRRSRAPNGENLAKIRENGPKTGDDIALDGGNGMDNGGNGPRNGDGVGVTLGGGKGKGIKHKNTGKGPSWAQIVGGTPHANRK